VVVYWSIETHKESTLAINSIFEPNEKIALTNALFKAIVQSDQHLSSYVLTGDTAQLISYRAVVEEADGLISELNDRVGDKEVQQAQVDTLYLFLSEKARVSTLLIDLKIRQGTEFFTQEALSRIQAELSDTVYIEKLISEKADVILKRDTIELQELVRTEDDFKGLRGALRRLWGKERARIDTIVTRSEQIDYQFAFATDSAVVRDYFKDSTLMAVNSILTQVLRKEIALQNDLRRTELEILTYNEVLVQSVRDLLEGIEAANSSMLIDQQSSAKQRIARAQQSAFLMAGIGLFVGFILFVVFIRDVARATVYRKQLEAEKDRAQELARSKERFLSRMSHEIRTPLHSISGYSELLRERLDSDALQDYLQGISSANDYLKELVNNILDQAKMESGQFTLERGTVFLPTLCSELSHIFQFAKESKSIEFVITMNEPAQHQSIITDGMRLKQVLVNLLSNAFKFTAAGMVKLELGLSDTGNQVFLNLIVSDTGCGIARDDLDLVFEPFIQAKQGRKYGVGGSGLGLAITRQIVDSMSGIISVHSTVDEGSVFQVTVPIEIDNKRDDSIGATNLDAVLPFLPKHIVAVEDDVWNANLLKELIQGQVSSIRVFHTAEEAVRFLKTEDCLCDLILTDLNLPGMSGRDLLMVLRNELNIRVPVVAFSAGLQKKNLEALEQEGFACALSKPFSKEALWLAVSVLQIQEEEQGAYLARLSLDLHVLLQLLQGSIEEKTLTIRDFEKSFEDKLETFSNACEMANSNELTRVCHQLRSMCDQVGHSSSNEQLQTIEVLVSLNKDARAFEVAKSLLRELLQVKSQLHSAIEQIIAAEFRVSE